MGREIRKVAKNWEHPKNEEGHYIPLFNEYYGDVVEEWYKEHHLWLEGKHPNQLKLPDDTAPYKFFAQWASDCPVLDSYRRVSWTEEEANCFQMYENVTEGTPISPVFESLQALEDWLVSQGASRTAAHNFCESGYAPSFIINMSTGEMKSGVDACE